MKIIYDFGANRGQNLHYYLQKADKVIAVEANATLCHFIGNRFKKEIDAGRLIVLNKAIALHDESSVDFYVHKKRNVLSKIELSAKDNRADFTLFTIVAQRASQIIEEFGAPYFVKIDLEGIDHLVLKDMLSAKIYPAFISVEAHTKAVFETLKAANVYTVFNLVKGSTVPFFYPDFNQHSAGPFGFDLKSPWLSIANFEELLSKTGFGWMDIHASLDTSIKPAAEIDFSFYKKFNRFGLLPRLRVKMNNGLRKLR